MLLLALAALIRKAPNATKAARHNMPADKARNHCPPRFGPRMPALATPFACSEAYLPMNFAVVSQGFAVDVAHGVVVVGQGVVVVAHDSRAIGRNVA